MTSRLPFLAIFSLLFLFTNVHASRHQSLRQKRADVCTDLAVNPCDFIRCENNGQCFQDSNTIDCYRCLCTPGFSGKLCETSVPILPAGCAPGCQNQGFCNGNVCQCLAGYTGTFCETNYCLPNNPCQNGGRCVSDAGGYQCDCTGTGYTGRICTDAIVTDPCASNPCVNGGLCSSNGGQVSCQCIIGYSGQYCQFAPVPCVTIPCQNGGTCNVLSTSGSGCVCTAQYTGAYCDTQVITTHPCATMGGNLCKNGGECLVNEADYVCKCATGWTGRNCDIPQTTISCNPNPCLHGTCTEVSISDTITPFCTCNNGWTGRFCDVNIDGGCYAGYCLSGGVCRMNGNVRYCECLPSYTGQRCESLITAVTTTTTTTGIMGCVPDPCVNGGRCYLDNNNVARCACQPGWTGQRCEISFTTTTTTTLSPGVLACLPNPCQNGGNCYNSGNSFVCACPTTWTGRICETPLGFTTTTTLPPVVSACFPNPCQNGGNCYISGNSFVCACPITWSGRICEIPLGLTTTTTLSPGVSACLSNPCQNGGSCFNNGNSFVCGCLSTWTGRVCETPLVVTPATTLPPGVSACASNPCLNGGTCYGNTNAFVCTCLPAYTGDRCQYSQAITVTTPLTTPSVINACASQPCRNGGICYNFNNSFRCLCSNSYTGTYCESIIVANCPLNCAPGVCTLSGSTIRPYVCNCNGVLKPTSCTSK